MTQTFPIWVDVTAIAAGAMLGSIAAVRRHAPLVGILLIGMVTGLGGGVLRDLLLNTDVAAIRNALFLPTVLIASLLAIPLFRVIPKTPGMTIGLDAFGMGAFVVAGVEKGLTFGLGATQAIFVGVVTATGGGILADLIMGEKPIVMQRGRWYVSAAVAGAIYFFVGMQWFAVEYMRISTVLVVILIRELSERFGWDAPTADLLIKRPRRR